MSDESQQRPDQPSPARSSTRLEVILAPLAVLLLLQAFVARKNLPREPLPPVVQLLTTPGALLFNAALCALFAVGAFRSKPNSTLRKAFLVGLGVSIMTFVGLVGLSFLRP